MKSYTCNCLPRKIIPLIFIISIFIYTCHASENLLITRDGDIAGLIPPKLRERSLSILSMMITYILTLLNSLYTYIYYFPVDRYGFIVQSALFLIFLISTFLMRRNGTGCYLLLLPYTLASFMIMYTLDNFRPFIFKVDAFLFPSPIYLQV
jgi:hypothetical protein